MTIHGRYPAELRERAVRMVLDHEQEYESQWEAITSVAEMLGPTAETVRKFGQGFGGEPSVGVVGARAIGATSM